MSSSCLEADTFRGYTLEEWKQKFKLIPNYDVWDYEDDTIYFDEEKANNALAFIRNYCTHIEGILNGKPLIPEPWQEAIIGAIFGFYRLRTDDGITVRRYKEVFIYVPRKNGKTPLVSAIVAYEFFCGPEQGQQVYVCAGNKEQANIFSRTFTGMINNCPALSSQVTIRGSGERTPLSALSVTVVRNDDNSFVKTISSVAETKHGFNINLVVVEEVHAHKFRDLYDTMATAMVSSNRISPLLIGISTADKERESVCNEKLDYSKEIQKKPTLDETFLPIIYETLKNENWKDEKVWRKCNPNLGISVSLDNLRTLAKQAEANPAFTPTFKRLHLNMKTAAHIKAFEGMSLKKDLGGLSPWEWRQYAIQQCKGFECIASLDLASTADLCCYLQLFRGIPGFKEYVAIPHFWIAKNAFSESHIQGKKRNFATFNSWVDQGFLKLQQNNIIKYKELIEDIHSHNKGYQVAYIICDVLFQGVQAAQELAEKYSIEAFKNNFSSHTLPIKELFRLLDEDKLDHGNNPVLLWCLSNAISENNHQGYIRFNKEKSPDKIDGAICLIMALNKYMFLDLEHKTKKKKSVYDKKPLKVL